MKHIAQDAVTRGLSYLESERYGPDPVRAYGKEWRRLARYCEERCGGLLDEAAVGRFLADTGIPGAPLTAYEKQRFRAAHALLDIAETGRPAPMYGDRTRFKVPSCLLDVYRAYEDRLAGREYADSTMRRKLGFARKTLSWLGESGIGSAEDVTAAAMLGFAGSLSGMTAQSRATWLYFVREFASFLADEFGADPGLKLILPRIKSGADSAIPSAFSADELAAILEKSGEVGQTPKMNRAMISLAMLLGMRAGDIRELKLSSIDWRNGRLSFVQQKTGEPLSLPLPEECALALADYLKNERPESDEPYVFLRSRAPHGPLSRYCNMERIVRDCALSAGIGIEGRRHGMHALRHGAALGMLEGGSGYPTIAGVLGHRSTSATQFYLRVDVAALRALSLEVPSW